ncbi:MAG: uL22 family ribosomal protein [Candidatus Shikimatogenerans sp. JK-2022]|nr:uL22 family ribosomal protein [Candidatus Shikimatogenerans bostrichidophilus]
MGKRKRLYSYKLKQEKKIKNITLLNKVKISPKKIIPVIKLIKGKSINYALNILDNYISYKISNILTNLIKSAISNYKNKKGEEEIDKNKIFIKNIIVNSSGIKKKIKYVSLGRCHIIKKKISNIKLIIN